ncbi:MAG: Hsp20/alpha crystallin family protein [Chlorobi bacterium]|nr:Hsp20/alpha crystallin family protein [Chlorobiota bacterium]
MNLVRFNQHPVFSNFFENFEKSLSQTFDASQGDMPMVNVKDEDKRFVVELAAPGMEKKDFNISLENNSLTISSEKKEEKTEKNENYTMKEFSFNSFSRSFALPKNIKLDQIDANYKNGVLSISLPKKDEEAKLNRRISIK